MTTTLVSAAVSTRWAATGLVAVATTLTLAAPAAAASIGGSAAAPPPCGPLASAPPLALPATNTPAGPALRALAGSVTSAPGDAQTGRYTRISLSMTGADSSIGNCTTTVTDIAAETRWRDETRNSGRITGTPWHPATDPVPASVTTWYAPGELRGILPGRVPADPAQLAAALEEQAPGDPAGQMRTIGEIAGYHDTPLPVRRAILTVLAGIPGVRWHGPVTVAGRRCVAVSIAGDTAVQVLVVDRASGEIAAVEQVLTDPVIGHNLAVTVPYSLSRTLITDRGRNPYPGPTSR